MSIITCDAKVSMLFSFLLCLLIILLFLLLKKKIKSKLASAIPTGALLTLIDEKIQTPPLVALKTIKTLTM